MRYGGNLHQKNCALLRGYPAMSGICARAPIDLNILIPKQPALDSGICARSPIAFAVLRGESMAVTCHDGAVELNYLFNYILRGGEFMIRQN